MKRYSLLILTGLVLLAAPAFGQFYEYTDRDGNIVFTDKPPAGSDARAKPLKEEGIYRSNRGEGDYPVFDDKKTGSRERKKRKKSYNRVSVIMYMTDWCGYCKKAREYIRSLGADLIEYNIENDKSRKNEMRRKSGGATGVPLIDIDGTLVRGYNPAAIKAALDRSAR